MMPAHVVSLLVCLTVFSTGLPGTFTSDVKPACRIDDGPQVCSVTHETWDGTAVTSQLSLCTCPIESPCNDQPGTSGTMQGPTRQWYGLCGDSMQDLEICEPNQLAASYNITQIGLDISNTGIMIHCRCPPGARLDQRGTRQKRRTIPVSLYCNDIQPSRRSMALEAIFSKLENGAADDMSTDSGASAAFARNLFNKRALFYKRAPFYKRAAFYKRAPFYKRNSVDQALRRNQASSGIEKQLTDFTWPNGNKKRGLSAFYKRAPFYKRAAFYKRAPFYKREDVDGTLREKMYIDIGNVFADLAEQDELTKRGLSSFYKKRDVEKSKGSLYFGSKGGDWSSQNRDKRSAASTAFKSVESQSQNSVSETDQTKSKRRISKRSLSAFYKRSPESMMSFYKRFPQDFSSFYKRSPSSQSLFYKRSPDDLSSFYKRSPYDLSSFYKRSPYDLGSFYKRSLDEGFPMDKKPFDDLSSFYKRSPNDLSFFYKRSPNDIKSFYKRSPDELSSFYKRSPNNLHPFYKRYADDLSSFYKRSIDDVRNFYKRAPYNLSQFYKRANGEISSFYKRSMSDSSSFY